jgi:hypothetical protein
MRKNPKMNYGKRWNSPMQHKNYSVMSHGGMLRHEGRQYKGKYGVTHAHQEQSLRGRTKKGKVPSMPKLKFMDE